MADYSTSGTQRQLDQDRQAVAKRQAELLEQKGGGGDTNSSLSGAQANAEYFQETGRVPDSPDVYQSPGSADWGGYEGAVDDYRNAALTGAKQNDAQQAGNTAALQRSIANMRGAEARGPMAIENKLLAQREQLTRGEQLGALGLMRGAAMGQAPSEADYQTRIGQNEAFGQQISAMGGARGAAALGGAQGMGSATMGQSSGNIAAAGGMARSKEIGEAIGQYGGMAGQLRGQDLTRLGVSNQNARFNQTLNDEWKVGNANNAIAQGRLGVAQSGVDAGWYDEAMRPAETQFRYDQEMAAEQAGANIDDAANRYAKNKDERQHTQQVVGGVVQGGLTAVGAMGGPAGAAAGGMAGTAINSATSRYY